MEKINRAKNHIRKNAFINECVETRGAVIRRKTPEILVPPASPQLENDICLDKKYAKIDKRTN